MMSCPRHPLAAAHAGHCAACLIEGAFFEPEAAEGGRRREFTILIPLGGSRGLHRLSGAGAGRARTPHAIEDVGSPGAAGISHGVRAAADAPGGLARRWCRSAGGGGRRRRRVARSSLASSGGARPIVGQVRTGRLDAGRATGFLRALVASTGQAHAAGLVHGAIGPGNVISDGRSAYLLDFGLRAIVSPPDAGRASAFGDLEGFAALERSVRDAVSPGVKFQAL